MFQSNNRKELRHTGVIGMKWGVHRSSSASGTSSSRSSSKKETTEKPSIKSKLLKTKGTKQKSENVESPKTQTKKSIKDMTDSEIRDKINRLDLEKRYSELESQMNQKSTSKGRAFVNSVVEQSAKNIATQAATYVMGQAVNKAMANAFNDPRVVNPKKGQKDK